MSEREKVLADLARLPERDAKTAFGLALAMLEEAIDHLVLLGEQTTARRDQDGLPANHTRTAMGLLEVCRPRGPADEMHVPIGLIGSHLIRWAATRDRA